MGLVEMRNIGSKLVKVHNEGHKASSPCPLSGLVGVIFDVEAGNPPLSMLEVWIHYLGSALFQ